MSYPIYIDRFSAGLDELTRKEQRNSEAVLAVLRQAKRFSAFEASDNAAIARTMTMLIETGRVTTDNSCGYPWVIVTHIDGEVL